MNPVTAASVTAGFLAALGGSARWNWWRFPARGLPILMYHKVGAAPEGSRVKKLWVSTKQFHRQMSYLKDRGYRPKTFEEVTSLVDQGRPIPEKSVIISFDDGYRNNYENAFPILKEFGFKAVVFLVVQAIGWDNFWHDPASEIRIPMLSWKEVEEMQSSGVEFGSHTMTHPRLSQLELKEATVEIQKSRRLLTEFLGRAPVSFAYPYGDGQDVLRLQQLVREVGYRWACSIHQGKAQPLAEPYSLHRIFVRGDDAGFDFHLNMTRGRSRF